MDRRFGGLARLYGTLGAARIAQAHVMVVGIGGVGSWAVESLARSGVAQITMVDLDHVAESNINRQIHATESTIGMAKVDAMRQRVASFHPECQINGIEEFVDASNWVSLLPQGVHAVIDACDQVRAKTAMAAWSKHQDAHFITVGAAGGKRLAHLVEIDDLVAVTHDPLLAQLRYRLRKEHGAARLAKKIGVASVFSREPVQTPEASCATGGDGSLNCHGYGSVVSVTATFGQCAAGWVLNEIANSP